MAFFNEHYLKLQAGYLFPEISRRVQAFCESHPHQAAQLVRLGIGDVTEPLPAAAIAALHRAADEMGRRETFRGYGPEQGYDFLRHAIAHNDFRARDVQVADDEIFVSDGSKCDCGNILDILSPRNRVAVMDPVYPVYVDTNVMAGHTGPADPQGAYSGLVYLPCTPENNFVPSLPAEPVDLIYLCYPNNPTREQLAAWVDYARHHRALILYDAAYEAYITDPALPRSIFEIPGARSCAIEFRSFSKNGGFTGTRCAFTVVPRELEAAGPDGQARPLHALWLRRTTTKFNGVSYLVQRAAESLYTAEGKSQIEQLVQFYLGNARILRDAAAAAGFEVHGGLNAPYLWVRLPAGISSWIAFDRLLQETHLVVTPGSGFGREGEGFIRISAFNHRDQVEAAANRLRALCW